MWRLAPVSSPLVPLIMIGGGGVHTALPKANLHNDYSSKKKPAVLARFFARASNSHSGHRVLLQLYSTVYVYIVKFLHLPEYVTSTISTKLWFFMSQNPPAQAPPSPSHGRKGERRTGHHSPQHHKREKLTAAQQLGIAPHPQVNIMKKYLPSLSIQPREYRIDFTEE